MKQLLHDFDSVSVHVQKKDDNPEFSITNEFTLLTRLHQKMFDLAKKKVDVIIPYVSPEIVESFQRALKRGVKIRFLAGKPTFRATFPMENALKTYPLSLEVRTLPHYEWGMHIFDNKQVTLAIRKDTPTPSLTTNNWRIVNIVQTYFDNKWKTAEILNPR